MESPGLLVKVQAPFIGMFEHQRLSNAPMEVDAVVPDVAGRLDTLSGHLIGGIEPREGIISPVDGRAEPQPFPVQVKVGVPSRGLHLKDTKSEGLGITIGYLVLIPDKGNGAGVEVRMFHVPKFRGGRGERHLHRCFAGREFCIYNRICSNRFCLPFPNRHINRTPYRRRAGIVDRHDHVDVSGACRKLTPDKDVINMDRRFGHQRHAPPDSREIMARWERVFSPDHIAEILPPPVTTGIGQPEGQTVLLSELDPRRHIEPERRLGHQVVPRELIVDVHLDPQPGLFDLKIDPLPLPRLRHVKGPPEPTDPMIAPRICSTAENLLHTRGNRTGFSQPFGQGRPTTGGGIQGKGLEIHVLRKIKGIRLPLRLFIEPDAPARATQFSLLTLRSRSNQPTHHQRHPNQYNESLHTPSVPYASLTFA